MTNCTVVKTCNLQFKGNKEKTVLMSMYIIHCTKCKTLQSCELRKQPASIECHGNCEVDEQTVNSGSSPPLVILIGFLLSGKFKLQVTIEHDRKSVIFVFIEFISKSPKIYCTWKRNGIYLPWKLSTLILQINAHLHPNLTLSKNINSNLNLIEQY